jgi:hypothetical protein
MDPKSPAFAAFQQHILPWLKHSHESKYLMLWAPFYYGGWKFPRMSYIQTSQIAELELTEHEKHLIDDAIECMKKYPKMYEQYKNHFRWFIEQSG